MFMSMRRETLRQGNRGYIDNEYVDRGYLNILPKACTVVYVLLVRRANHTSQTCFPSIKGIIKDSAIGNRNTVVKALTILRLHKIIDIEHSRGGKSNIFLLISHEFWLPPDRIIIDTVMKGKGVSNSVDKLYQKDTQFSIKSDTGIELSKLTNEFTVRRKNSDAIIEVLSGEWSRDAVAAALDILTQQKGKRPSLREVQTYLQQSRPDKLQGNSPTI